MRTIAVVLLVACGVPARADEVNVASITADGQTVRNLSCKLESAGLLAVIQIVGTLAKQKRALDGCAPAGGAFQVKWSWSGGKASDVAVLKSSAASKAACVARALKLTRSELAGSCRAIVLVGDQAAANKAADALSSND